MTPVGNNTPLEIDAPKAIIAFREYLKAAAAAVSTGEVLLGLSGGIDSALLAALAADALGGGAVHAVYLHDRDSAPTLAQRARLVADWLGLDLLEVSIDAEMSAAGIYSTSPMQFTAIAALLNRLFHKVYRLAFGETAFMTSLRSGQARFAGEDAGNVGFREAVLQVEAGMSARHRHRRKVLEEMAAARDWLLLGAANCSEWLTGWFVKDGVDDLPLQPLIGLYKTQVRQLAAALGLPAEIIRQPPSPDMRKGITDELGLGLPYASLDLILDHLAGGVSRTLLAEKGITARQIELVREMNRLSGWKRRPLIASPPVDGAPRSEYRRDRFSAAIQP